MKDKQDLQPTTELITLKQNATELMALIQKLQDFIVKLAIIEEPHWHEAKAKAELQLTIPNAMRLFTPSECLKLNVQCRSLLLKLELIAILDPESRELVIAKLLELDTEMIEPVTVQWLTIMVILSKPQRQILVDIVIKELIEQLLFANNDYWGD